MIQIIPIKDQDKQAFRDEYSNAVDTLEQIRDAETLTQAQAIQAIQYIAKVLLFLIKLLARVF